MLARVSSAVLFARVRVQGVGTVWKLLKLDFNKVGGPTSLFAHLLMLLLSPPRLAWLAMSFSRGRALGSHPCARSFVCIAQRTTYWDEFAAEEEAAKEADINALVTAMQVSWSSLFRALCGCDRPLGADRRSCLRCPARSAAACASVAAVLAAWLCDCLHQPLISRACVRCHALSCADHAPSGGSASGGRRSHHAASLVGNQHVGNMMRNGR